MKSVLRDCPARSSWFSCRSVAFSVFTFSSSMRSLAFSCAKACSASRISSGGSLETVEDCDSAAARRACSALTWFSSLACSLCSARLAKYWRLSTLHRNRACIRTAAFLAFARSRQAMCPLQADCSFVALNCRFLSLKALLAKTLLRQDWQNTMARTCLTKLLLHFCIRHKDWSLSTRRLCKAYLRLAMMPLAMRVMQLAAACNNKALRSSNNSSTPALK
mmetsp:Transcript_24339/g.56528  ORF Transcript_24339/g.56528 Transcript_24339/m.56528 type:complete len:220 (-) Transcript_24339:2460-3119(-)